MFNMCKEMVFDELSVNDTKSNNKSNRRKIQNDESKMTNKDTLMLSKLAINSKSPRLSAELKSFRSSQGKQAEESIPDKSSSDNENYVFYFILIFFYYKSLINKV